MKIVASKYDSSFQQFRVFQDGKIKNFGYRRNIGNIKKQEHKAERFRDDYSERACPAAGWSWNNPNQTALFYKK